MISYH